MSRKLWMFFMEKYLYFQSLARTPPKQIIHNRRKIPVDFLCFMKKSSKFSTNGVPQNFSF